MSLQRLSTGEATHTIHLETDDGVLMYVDGAKETPENALTITVVGIDSKTYRRREARITNRQLTAMAGTRKEKKKALSVDDRYDLISCCVQSWQNIAESPEDEDLPCDFENTLMVMKTYGSVFDQVAEAVENRALYQKK